MKNKTIGYIPCLLAISTIVALGSFSAASAFISKGVSNLSFAIRESTKTITLYTDYDNGEWTSANILYVRQGEEITSATDPSVSGYDFLGWRTTAPGTGDGQRDIAYTTSELNDIVVDDSDLTYYPVFKSSSKKAYADTNYYEINTDVVISSNSIGATSIGYRYLGVSGIYEVTSTWNDTRSLYSASGIYKFYESGDYEHANGAASLDRKLGFKPNSHWGASWDNSSCGFGIDSWSGDNHAKIHMGNTTVDTTIYVYIPAYYVNFQIRRYSSNAGAFVDGDGNNNNRSGNLSFDNSWYWNGSSTNRYTKDTIVLDMTTWDNWVDNWGSSNAEWSAS